MTHRQTLVLQIAPTRLRGITERGLYTVIAKNGPSETRVAWLAWEPSTCDTIVWDEAYGLYAAGSSLQEGRVIRLGATVDAARDRHTYPFHGEQFGEPIATPHLP